MDGQIIPIAHVEARARAALAAGDARNPYPPFTPAHEAWSDVLARLRTEETTP